MICGGDALHGPIWRRTAVVTVLTLVMLLVCLDSCEAVDTQANRLRLLRYVQRVGTVMENLANSAGATAGGAPDIGTTALPPRASTSGVTTAANRKGLTADQAALASSSTALPDWLHAPHEWLQRKAAAFTETAEHAMRLFHVVAGGPLTDEEVEARQKRSSSAWTTPRAGAVRSASATASASTTANTRSASVRAASDSEETPQASLARCGGDGRALLATTSLMQCQTKDGNEVLLTALEYSAEADPDHTPSYTRCHVVIGTGVQCLCPPGYDIEARHGGTAYTCVVRNVDVIPQLPESQLCHDEAAAQVGLPSSRMDEYCLTTTRRAVLTLSVTWHYKVVIDANASDTSVSGRDGDNTTEYVVLPSDTVGTLDQLRNKLFVSELWHNESSLKLLRSHPFFEDTEAFTQVFCFSSPVAALPHRQVLFLNTTNAVPYLGSASGTSSHTVTLDLSALGDEMVEGNQLYIETGVHGNYIPNLYRVSRVHVRFSDLAAPPVRYHYSKPMNVMYIALIVLICVVVVVVALLVVWCVCTREVPEEDDAVSRTVRKREERKSTITKKKN